MKVKKEHAVNGLFFIVITIKKCFRIIIIKV
jgi:hypothetical protein